VDSSRLSLSKRQRSLSVCALCDFNALPPIRVLVKAADSYTDLAIDVNINDRLGKFRRVDDMPNQWNAKTGAAVGDPLDGHTDYVYSVAYSPDGQHITSGSNDNTIRIWGADTGAAVGNPLYGHSKPVFSVAYSPDGQYMISGSQDRTVRIWDARTGAAVGKPLEGHPGEVWAVAYMVIRPFESGIPGPVLQLETL